MDKFYGIPYYGIIFLKKEKKSQKRLFRADIFFKHIGRKFLQGFAGFWVKAGSGEVFRVAGRVLF